MASYRKADTLNLIVGIFLILLGMGGIINIAAINLAGLDLFWNMIFLTVFVLIGGYETGKYAEMHHNNKKKNTGNST